MEKLKKITVSAIVADIIAIFVLAGVAMQPVNPLVLVLLVLALIGFGFDLSRAITFYYNNLK